jgi:hypothetical protein
MSEIFVTNLAAYTSPEVVELKNKDWVQYGESNQYFNYIIEVNNNSTTCRAICTGTANMIYGKGLAAHDGDRRVEQYAQMMSLFKKKDLRRFINDYKILGMAAFQIVYEAGRVTQVHHFPMETLRAEKCSEVGDIEGWYYSNHWSNLKPNEKPDRIPAFGFGSGNETEMYVLKPYEAGKYYYSEPDWSSAMPYAVLEDEIADYLINDCINGFSGTKVVNFNNGVPDPDKMQSIKNDVLQKLTGSRGEKTIVAFNSNAESKTTIDDIPLNNAPEHYSYLADECFKKLIVGHRVTSPMLLGIREGNDGMGNNADEIKVATQLFDSVVIQNFQDQVIECIDEILSVNDIALDLYFKTLKPIEFSDIDIVNEEIIEEETGYELGLKKIDGIEAYKTIKEAEAKALEQGCKGHHEHEMDGEVWYMPCESHEENISKDLKNFISLGEDFPKKDWELIEDAEVDYEIEDGLDELISELNYKPKNILSKIWKFIETGSPFPNSKGDQDRKIGDEYFRTRYYYSPQGFAKSERPFCRAMVKANKIYRKQDIIQMEKQSVNPGWGPEGSNKYSIWFYKGGGNCHHSWRRLTYRFMNAKIDVKSTQDLITTRRARKDGYKIINDRKVSQKPINMPNRGFLPGNPQGK